jgi:hypothetical protein
MDWGSDQNRTWNYQDTRETRTAKRHVQVRPEKQWMMGGTAQQTMQKLTHPSPRIPGDPVSGTTDSTISTVRVESDNTGLSLPCLQATGEPMMGANKKWMHTGNRKRISALQQVGQALPLWMTHEGTGILPAQSAN